MQFAFKNWTVKMFAATATYHIMPCSSSYEQPRHPLSKILFLFILFIYCILYFLIIKLIKNTFLLN